MEHFLVSPMVLSLFDMNSTFFKYQTGNHHEDPCRHIDNYSQMLLAILDQAYHSSLVLDPTFDSIAEVGVIPHIPHMAFQTQFGHLFGYGATYYSYLFDCAIASVAIKVIRINMIGTVRQDAVRQMSLRKLNAHDY
jgi:intermediate peptidase